MDMYYWTGFSKRENSTKLPTDTGTKVEILLKEDTSIDAPSIVLTGNILNLDYCYIPDFGKYYFVGSPVILANDMTQYDLVEDCLGTHKTEIGNTVAHIAYASTGYNVDIVDARMAVLGSRLFYQTFETLPFDKKGCYCVGVVNGNSSGRQGSVTYYLMDDLELTKIIAYMMQDEFLQCIEEYFNGKVIDLIQSCIWLPLKYADAIKLFHGSPATPETQLKIGNTILSNGYDNVFQPLDPILMTIYPINTPVAELQDSNGYVTMSVAIGNKWQDFRDCQPYSSASLYLPGVGVVDLNINDFYGSSNVNINILFDVITGDCTYRILDDDGNLLKTIAFNTSVNVSLAQITTNVSGALTGIGGVAGGITGLGITAATGNVVGVVSSGMGIVASGTAAIMAANQRSVSIKGTNNGRSAFDVLTAILTLVQLDTEDIDDANYIAKCGRPVCETHSINNHSGYVQCEAATIEIAGDSFERETINRFLNSGFYYE